MRANKYGQGILDHVPLTSSHAVERLVPLNASQAFKPWECISLEEE
jgi:hypothetical protein